jgi:hypothetical protein
MPISIYSFGFIDILLIMDMSLYNYCGQIVVVIIAVINVWLS